MWFAAMETITISYIYLAPRDQRGKAIVLIFCGSVVPFVWQSLPSKYHWSADGKTEERCSCRGLKLLHFRLRQERPDISNSHPEQQLRSQTLGLQSSLSGWRGRVGSWPSAWTSPTVPNYKTMWWNLVWENKQRALGNYRSGENIYIHKDRKEVLDRVL